MASFAFNFRIDPDDIGAVDASSPHHLTEAKRGAITAFTTKESKTPAALLGLSLDTDELPVCEDNVVDSVETVGNSSASVSYYSAEEVNLWVRANGYQAASESSADQPTDLVSGVYEGGFQLWECSADLADWLLAADLPPGQRVIEPGCGSGLPALCCLRKHRPSRLAFQDFNAEVLRAWTMPNCRLNLSQLSEQPSDLKLDFFAGTWASLAVTDSLRGAFDLVLTAETIYNPGYYDQLHDALSHIMAPGGSALVAAKVSYFGVGGSESLFCDCLDQRGVFSCERVLRIDHAALTRVILRLRRKDE